MINIPKGTKDVLPQDSYKWQYVEQKIREICHLYNFKEIRTPTFEHTELFLRSIGEDTDVVGKEMYTFEDKAGRSITLKAEGTAPVARAFVENSLDALSLPLKMFYITPVFRYEKPQDGRLREHHQFGVELYGGDTPYNDYEVISLAYNFIKSMGIDDVELHINSIGCPQCRKNYNQALVEYLRSNENKLCETCKSRMQRNPMRVLDCKVPGCKEIVKNAPNILDYICDDCHTFMEKLKDLLNKGGIKYKVDSSIVRGLDYYTKTVFEFVTNALGSQGTVCGGGRYNNLVQSVGGKPTPCVGFGMGIERLLMLMNACGVAIPDNNHPNVFIASQSAEYMDLCLKIVQDLRKEGVAAETDLTGKSLKSQMKYADKIGAKYVVVIGPEEAQSGEVTLKRMSDGDKKKTNLSDLKDLCRR